MHPFKIADKQTNEQTLTNKQQTNKQKEKTITNFNSAYII